MKSFLRFLFLLIISLIGISVFVVVKFNQKYPLSLGPQFDITTRFDQLNNIEAIKPEIILIGDSTLAQSIDMDKLQENLKKTIYEYTSFGSTSAVWYLILKNSIIASAFPPKEVIIFFRDTMLTAAEYHVDGPFLSLVNDFAGPDDYLVVQLSYINSMSRSEKFINQYFPIYGDRNLIKDKIENRLRYSLPQKLFNISKKNIKEETDIVFAAEQKIPEVYSGYIHSANDELYSAKNLNFDKQISQSYLPEMIRLSKENNIHLVFVQLKTIRFSDEKPPEALLEYSQKLQEYLRSQAVGFIDFSEEASLPPNLFSDEIHMNIQGKEIFTAVFSNRIAAYIQK
jgi:hypothetical protein